MTESEAPGAPVDRPQVTGSIGLVLVVAVALVALVVFLLFVGRDRAGPYILAALAVLAVIGVFALFAGAAGILQLAGRGARNDMTKAITDSAWDGLAVVDSSGRVLYANRAYLEITHAESPEDARPVERLFTGDPGVSEAIYRLAQAAREGNRFSEEIRFAGKGGTPARWLRFRVRPLGPEGRRSKLAIWGVSDVTRERERQENAFIELQHAIDYLDHAPAGFFSCDAAGRIVYLNATLAGWLGYDLAEFSPAGLKISDLVQGSSAALLTGIATVHGEVVTQVLDLDLRRKNGQSLPVRLHHKVAFAPDGTAGPSRTLVLNRAPTDAPGDAARAAEVRFARFFNNAPMAIATIDKHGRIGQSNANFARLVGGAETRSVFAVADERERARFESFVRGVLEGQAGTKTLEVGLTGGQHRFAQFYVTPVEGGTGGEAAIVHAIDTTEQRALQGQFSQAQKMNAVGQLAGGVAHDFNNMLTAMIGYTDLLLANHRPTDPSFQDLMQIKQNANRAAGLVRQLLAFSRQQTLRPRVLQLGEVLSDLSTGLLKRIIGETVKLEVRHGRDLWPVKADLNQFEQVIVNLAVNARDAMPSGGRLTIRTSNVPADEVKGFGHAEIVAADYVLVEVADSGVGIAPDTIDKIFEPFFTTKEVGKGTGLGLSTVYGIIKQSGGFIHAKSTPSGGSTFSILLPRHVSDAAEDAQAAPEAPAAAAADLTGTGTVLLVEDEEAVRAFAARALASRGYTVLEAASGVDALAVIDEHGGEVDLIVSDVVMPEMDGPTLLKELRRRRSDVKVIFVSGYAEEAFRKNLPEGEKFTFLPKPFTLKELVAAVKEAMTG
ncbi:MAG TPA: PAS domain-containing protein [Xanthobacteraceae bacterium]|jgi:two-component system cell cycle sensor histidine kinase/response regulator CckA